jgi:hypothetical protein
MGSPQPPAANFEQTWNYIPEVVHETTEWLIRKRIICQAFPATPRNAFGL